MENCIFIFESERFVSMPVCLCKDWKNVVASLKTTRWEEYKRNIKLKTPFLAKQRYKRRKRYKKLAEIIQTTYFKIKEMDIN